MEETAVRNQVDEPRRVILLKSSSKQFLERIMNKKTGTYDAVNDPGVTPCCDIKNGIDSIHTSICEEAM